MITIKVGKDIKIQKHLINGVKITIHLDNGKWSTKKLDKHQSELLKFSLELLLPD